MTNIAKLLFIATFLNALVSTNSYPTQVPRQPARVTIVVKALSPPAGSVIDEHTVIRAELEYTAEMARLSNASGTKRITHPMIRELKDPRLAKPVKMHFVMLQGKGGNAKTEMAATEAIVYRTE